MIFFQKISGILNRVASFRWSFGPRHPYRTPQFTSFKAICAYPIDMYFIDSCMVCDRPFKYIIKEETADSDLIYLTSKYNLTLPDSFYEEMKGKSASSNSKRAYTNWQGI